MNKNMSAEEKLMNFPLLNPLANYHITDKSEDLNQSKRINGKTNMNDSKNINILNFQLPDELEDLSAINNMPDNNYSAYSPCLSNKSLNTFNKFIIT